MEQNFESEKQNTQLDNKSSFWEIILKNIGWIFKAIIYVAFYLSIKIFIGIMEAIFCGNKKGNTNKSMKSNKTKPKNKGKMTAYDILLARGYSEKEASRAIRNCQRDLEMAMDDGAMEELEDIVVEDLGVDSRHVEELI